MTLKTQMADDLSIFFDTDEFAETISYTPLDDAARNITAIVDRSAPGQEPYIRGHNTATCEISVKASDMPTPQLGDLFTIDDQTWEVDPSDGQGVIHEDDFTLTVALRRVD
jgi:hypothetical protein